MMGNVFSAGVAPLFGSIAPDLRCTTTEVSRLPGYAMLMLGVGVRCRCPNLIFAEGLATDDDFLPEPFRTPDRKSVV